MTRPGLGINISSLQVQRRLGEATSKLISSSERLSSGLRINRASDDAAGLSIASSLDAGVRVFTQGVRNINDGMSLLSIADSTLASLTDITTRIRELAQQSANGTYSAAQRQAVDAEAQALSAEFFRISRSATFNGIGIFDGDLSSLRIQAGYGIDGSVASALGGALGTGQFSEATVQINNEHGTFSSAVELGDVNGDGILDLISAGSDGGSGSILVRLGSGSGQFGQSTQFEISILTPSAMTLADLNGDGQLDIATAGTQGVSIQLGNGDGTFKLTASYSTASGYSAVTTGDLNGDGVLDLVTGGYVGATGGATIRLGNGDGTFRQVQSFETETYFTTTVQLADLNRDGKLDLVTTGGGSPYGETPYMTVLLGDGSGGFGPASSTMLTGFYGTDLGIGDLNGDGNLDIVAAVDNQGSGGFFEVQLGRGDGTFGAATNYASEANHPAIELGDVNGDGILDLVGAGYDGSIGLVDIRLGRGDGSFGASATFLAGNYDYFGGIALGDVDGDGVLDIAANGYDYPQGQTSILRGITREGINPILQFSLRTRADTLQAIGIIDRKLNQLTAQRGIIGAFQSRLGSALTNLQSQSESYSAASSRIKDVDIAAESANYSREQIVQQAAASVLAQANLAPQLVLRLLE